MVRDNGETKGERPYRLIDVARSHICVFGSTDYGSPNRPQCDHRDIKGQEAIFGLPDVDEKRSIRSWLTIQRTRRDQGPLSVFIFTFFPYTYSAYWFSFTYECK